MPKYKETKDEVLRNFVFGVEDSLVSTIGLVSGVAIAGVDKITLIITGIILIFVEAFSMAAGSLLSENSVEEYEEHKEVPLSRSFAASVVMFFSYFIAGMFILIPYIVTSEGKAFWIAIFVALAGLFLLGQVSAKVSKINPLKRGFVMAFIGGLAILVGTIVGELLTSIT